MEQIINQYLNSKQLAWSDVTYRNESARIQKWARFIDGNPTNLFSRLNNQLNRYSLVSLWNRVIEIWDLVDSNSNPYREFKAKNLRQFKNYYDRKVLGLTFQDALDRINMIEDREVRAKAIDLLHTGLRYEESQGEHCGEVIGKGGKKRKVFRPSHLQPVKFSRDYTTFLRHLKTVGLTAHMLRKLAATRLSRLGMKEQDLCKVFGWSNFSTARYYLQPMDDAKVQDLMEKL